MSEDQNIRGLYRVVTFPGFYNAFQNLLGSDGARKRYFDEWVSCDAADDVLDVGCGPAIAAKYLNFNSYTGIDLNPLHIASARNLDLPNTSFHLGDASSVLSNIQETYDVILSLGFLHHLVDENVRDLKAHFLRRLRPGGTIYFLEPVYLERQRRIARWMKDMDSGQNIRTEEDYMSLIADENMRFEHKVSHDLLRIPYDHIWGKLASR